jgi:hypothetical protein
MPHYDHRPEWHDTGTGRVDAWMWATATTTSTTTLTYTHTHAVTATAASPQTWASLDPFWWPQTVQHYAEVDDTRRHQAEAEAVRRREHAEARQRERAEARQRDDFAFRRAEALLLSFLTAAQRADYVDNRGFDVQADDGRTFRIHCDTTVGNVRLTEDRYTYQLCAHPPGGLPAPDVWLAQMLTLQTDASGFLDVANTHHVYRDDTPTQFPEVA